jgi:hypothetical protein
MAVSYKTDGTTYAAAALRHLKGKDERMIAAGGMKYKDEFSDRGR